RRGLTGVALPGVAVALMNKDESGPVRIHHRSHISTAHLSADLSARARHPAEINSPAPPPNIITQPPQHTHTHTLSPSLLSIPLSPPTHTLCVVPVLCVCV